MSTSKSGLWVVTGVIAVVAVGVAIYFGVQAAKRKPQWVKTPCPACPSCPSCPSPPTPCPGPTPCPAPTPCPSCPSCPSCPPPTPPTPCPPCPSPTPPTPGPPAPTPTPPGPPSCTGCECGGDAPYCCVTPGGPPYGCYKEGQPGCTGTLVKCGAPGPAPSPPGPPGPPAPTPSGPSSADCVGCQCQDGFLCCVPEDGSPPPWGCYPPSQAPAACKGKLISCSYPKEPQGTCQTMPTCQFQQGLPGVTLPDFPPSSQYCDALSAAPALTKCPPFPGNPAHACPCATGSCAGITPQFNWIIGTCQGCGPCANMSWRHGGAGTANCYSDLKINYLAVYTWEPTTHRWLRAQHGGIPANPQGGYADLQPFTGVGGAALWDAGLKEQHATEGYGPPGFMVVLSADKFDNAALYMLNQATLDRGAAAQNPACPDNCWNAPNHAGEIDLLEPPLWNNVDSCPHVGATVSGVPYDRWYVSTYNSSGACFPTPLGGRGGGGAKSQSWIANDGKPHLFAFIVDQRGLTVYRDPVWAGLPMKGPPANTLSARPDQAPTHTTPPLSADKTGFAAYYMPSCPSTKSPYHQAHQDQCFALTSPCAGLNWWDLLADTGQYVVSWPGPEYR